MKRRTPKSLRRDEDPVALAACRDRRIPAGKASELIAKAHQAMRVTASCVAEAFGLAVLRKHLWRPLRGTEVGDLLEARGLDDAPPTDFLLSVGEISGAAFIKPDPPRDEIIVSMTQRPRSRWFGHEDANGAPAHLAAPDAVLLQRDRTWRMKLAKHLPGFAQPCGLPKKMMCEMVYWSAVRTTWGVPNVDGDEAMRKVLGFAGVGVAPGDVHASIAVRTRALVELWKSGAKIPLGDHLFVVGAPRARQERLL